MADYIDLLIRLYRTPGMPVASPESYTALADMRVRDPQALTDDLASSWQIELNLTELIASQASVSTYGKILTRALFPVPQPLAYFQRARDRAALGAEGGRLLRVRLEIDSASAAPLHDLRWETLIDPAQLDKDSPFTLLQDPRIPFSRFLATEPWFDLSLRPQGRLRALIVVANPADLAKDLEADDDDDAGKSQLRRIDVEDEIKRARASLAPPGEDADIEIEIGQLATEKDQPPVTLNRLIGQISEGYDLLYLVCHGDQRGNPKAPFLLLEDATGKQDWVSGAQLVEQIRNLPRRPLLIVLAACRSAGTGEQARSRNDGGALAALGPRLVGEAGVPAVLAMSGKVQMSSVAMLMPAFFRALRTNQPIDQALAAARNTISREFDRYMPVLFMRLREGTLSYRGGFEGQNDDAPLESLKRSISSRRCVVILGPGLPQHLLGGPREWAYKLMKSIPATERPADGVRVDDLPQVAQYIARRLKREQFLASLANELLCSLLDRCRPSLDPELRDHTQQWRLINDPELDLAVRAQGLLALCGGTPPESVPPLSLWKDLTAEPRLALISRLTDAVGRSLRRSDPHRILARQPHAIYITANPDDLLVGALRAEGREPVLDYRRWNERLAVWPDSIYDSEPRYLPGVDPKRPLVLYLFGRYAQIRSLVLSEDDYFQYLMATSDLPTAVSSALVNDALLFLGFQVDEWSFRAAFRNLLNTTRSRQRKELEDEQLTIGRSVAVQLAPEQRSVSPAETRRYFNDFFGEAKIDIYWAQSDDFMRKL
jgi:hypothetical protein